MQTVNEKYQNFIAFITSTIKDNTYVQMLSTVPLDKFLAKLKTETRTPREIMNEICTRCQINKDLYPPEAIEKFVRYIEYFQKCSLVVH